MKDAKKKKGILAAIWESMTKTGGCCGPGEGCGCYPDEKNLKKKPGNKNLTNAAKRVSNCPEPALGDLYYEIRR